MSKDTDYTFVVRRNEYVAAESLIYLHGNNNGDYKKQEIVTDIYFEATVPSTKNNFFQQHMVDFLNKL